MFEFECTINFKDFICAVEHYYAGTDFLITSRSLEPNEEKEFEYVLLDADTREEADIKLTRRQEVQLMKKYEELMNE